MAYSVFPAPSSTPTTAQGDPIQSNSYSPYGLTLKQTITSGTTVTIPSGVNWVYAIVIGGGGGGNVLNGTYGPGGGGGGVTMGWTPVIAGATNA